MTEAQAIHEARLSQDANPDALSAAIEQYQRETSGLSFLYSTSKAFARPLTFGDLGQIEVLKEWRTYLKEAAKRARGLSNICASRR